MKRYRKIKFRILEGLRLNPLKTVMVLQEHEDRLKVLEDATGVNAKPKYNISFTITDGENPIDGAIVTIGDISGITGSAGGCTLQDVEEGTHEVNVNASGYSVRIEDIVVNESNTTFEIELAAI